MRNNITNSSTYITQKIEARKNKPLYHRTKFLLIGLSFSLLFTIVLMSWTTNHIAKTYAPMPEMEENLAYEIHKRIVFKDKRKKHPIPIKKTKPPAPVYEIKTIEDIPLDFIDPEVKAEELNDNASPIIDTFIASTPLPLPPEQETADDLSYTFVEQMPRFPGCEETTLTNKEKEACANKQLLEYIYKHLKYPAIARENGIEGTCIVQFVVNTKGTIEQAKLVKDIGGNCGQASIHAVTSMNNMSEKWNPGRQMGRKVKVLFTLPIKFALH